ncbi:hypothetical protein FKM82_025917 [Ascaphus truei]
MHMFKSSIFLHRSPSCWDPAFPLLWSITLVFPPMFVCLCSRVNRTGLLDCLRMYLWLPLCTVIKDSPRDLQRHSPCEPQFCACAPDYP